LLTPNVQEAAELSGRKVSNAKEMLDAGRALLDLGVNAVLLKGGHLKEPISTDRLLIAGQTEPIPFSAPRIETRNDHGTGCVLSSATAAGLALGKSLPEAVSDARKFLQDALQGAANVWNGDGRGGMNLIRMQNAH
jgi:hydroxymethylpyrimidine/phosphomethylpyrimidine kinase